jgi:hypothetical protein
MLLIMEIFLPKNLNLPFFAYGIFKPNQIAYQVIEDYVQSSIRKTIKNFFQFLRDGVSFIYPEVSSEVVTGYEITFVAEKAVNAYFEISNKEPGSLYRWEVIDNMNVLVAHNTDGFDEHFHGNPDNVIGWNDPYFHIGLEVIQKQRLEVKEMEYPINSRWDDRDFFAKMLSTQMRFLLAYSMLERLAFLMTSFQSGSAQVSNVLGENIFFKKAIIKVYEELPEERKSKIREVFSSERTLDSKGKVKTGSVNLVLKECVENKDYKKVIKFYYQIRNNITHRGKSLGRLSPELEEYLIELTSIIKYTLEFGLQSTKNYETN